MIKIENVSVINFDNAIRGMRNPLNSWNKIDSYYEDNKFILGPNDLALAIKLRNAGSDHRKFLRQVFVSLDITAPVYWFAELDTYKVGTTRNSCSFMHKGVSESFKIEDFSTHKNDKFPAINNLTKSIWNEIIKVLNDLRDVYLETKDPQIFQQIRCLLPSGYNQKSTITLNYENLINMYHSRKNHRLDEWREFCKWIETLPYAKELIVGENDE